MKERILTKEEQILVLETKIAERALIIYVDESAIADDEFHGEYTKVIKDEIANHNVVIQDYKEQLKQLLK